MIYAEYYIVLRISLHMLKNTIVILLFSLSLNTFAHDLSDDSTFHYIILQSKKRENHFVVFKENRTIKVHKIVGGYSKGRLNYINDSTFQLINRKRSRKDTFKISDIDAISSPGLLNKIIAYPCYIASSGFSFLGMILLIGDGSNDPISDAYGAMSLGIAAPLFTLGSILKRGKNYTTNSYYLRLIDSKKKNLNRRKINRMGFTCGS